MKIRPNYEYEYKILPTQVSGFSSLLQTTRKNSDYSVYCFYFLHTPARVLSQNNLSIFLFFIIVFVFDCNLVSVL